MKKRLLKIATLILVVTMLASVLVPIASADWRGSDAAGWRWRLQEQPGDLPDVFATGWQQIGGVWYWFDADGYMARNEFRRIGGHTYFFGNDGAMATGWRQITNPAHLTADGLPRLPGWYFFRENGSQLTGWLEWNNNWFFLEGRANTGGYGRMVANNWVVIGTQSYNFAGNGALVTGWRLLTEPDGTTNWYFLNADGTTRTGWLEWNGNWYYFWPVGGRMLSDGIFQLYLSLEEHAFRPDGRWIGLQNVLATTPPTTGHPDGRPLPPS